MAVRRLTPFARLWSSTERSPTSAPGWFFDASVDLATVIVRGVDNVTKMLDVQTKQGIVLPSASDYFFADT